LPEVRKINLVKKKKTSSLKGHPKIVEKELRGQRLGEEGSQKDRQLEPYHEVLCRKKGQ